jgi:hypothetical protein
MDEEERAALHRRNLAARCKATKARERALVGNKAAREALEARWAPLRDWLAEQ